MKFFKTTLLAGVLSINMAAPVFANQAPITEQIQPFTAADTQSLFEQDAKPMQLAALSQTEMKETEGAWLNFAVGGGIGLGSYLYSTPSNQWSLGGAAVNTGLGVLGGYSAGVAGLRVLGLYRNTGGFGVALGRPGIMNPSQWYGNANQFGRIDFHRNPHSSFVHTHRGGWLR